MPAIHNRIHRLGSPLIGAQDVICAEVEDALSGRYRPGEVKDQGVLLRPGRGKEPTRCRGVLSMGLLMNGSSEHGIVETNPILPAIEIFGSTTGHEWHRIRLSAVTGLLIQCDLHIQHPTDCNLPPGNRR